MQQNTSKFFFRFFVSLFLCPFVLLSNRSNQWFYQWSNKLWQNLNSNCDKTHNVIKLILTTQNSKFWQLKSSNLNIPKFWQNLILYKIQTSLFVRTAWNIGNQLYVFWATFRNVTMFFLPIPSTPKTINYVGTTNYSLYTSPSLSTLTPYTPLTPYTTVHIKTTHQV